MYVSDWTQLFQRGGLHHTDPTNFVLAQQRFLLNPPCSARLLLATHTSGPKDVPRCGALSFSLLQKTLHCRGGPVETAATLNVKLCVLVPACLVASYPLFSPILFSNLFEESTSNLARAPSCRGQCAPSRQACRHTACPGSAAGGQR